MKRLIIAVALVALMGGTVLAEGMSLGFKGGLNLANLTGDDIGGVKEKLCFSGGLFVNYPFTESISLQPELLFMMKGTKSQINDDAGYRMSYIDIPVLAKFAIPTEGAFIPCFFAGPYIGLNMSAEIDFGHDYVTDIKDYTNTIDFGLIFGGGFDYTVGGGYLTFDARYALGLRTIVDVEEVNIKNTGIIFMAGYGFSF